MDVAESSAVLLDGTGRWRARDVSYWAGRWARLERLVPKFTIEPFRVRPDSPANPHIQAVVRQPLTVTEQPIPVGTVSNSYQLAQHHEVVMRCFDGLRLVGVEPASLNCEVGLTPLGEWMNFRAYFPESHNYTPKDGNALGLRLECFNSVDGSSRLVILLGWLRFVCANGLVIGETKAELRDVHDEHLSLDAIPDLVVTGMTAVTADLQRLRSWEAGQVSAEELKRWADGEVSSKWGKKAACRVFHICRTGRDVEIVDPFAKGEATEKPVKPTLDVPGAAAPATTLYEVSQTLSWIATQRSNTEQRVEWQGAIPHLISSLRTESSKVSA
ncbi:MAG: DUF932 domain-containing protein [Xanthomonadales bacterium]|nr:DUF932 domain-containing protein [Xanthomonadales bacterium]